MSKEKFDRIGGFCDNYVKDLPLNVAWAGGQAPSSESPEEGKKRALRHVEIANGIMSSEILLRRLMS
jgi:hypothetical protein